MPRITTTKNLGAFLDMIAMSEGTKDKGDDGYNVIVGGKLFTSYTDHPRITVHLRPNLSSTAAGRYQLLARYFDAYKLQLKLRDFSPISQDLIAIQQIKESMALEAINSGDFEKAVQLCSHIWASLPGAGYHQHENSIVDLMDAYIAMGGEVQA